MKYLDPIINILLNPIYDFLSRRTYIEVLFTIGLFGILFAMWKAYIKISDLSSKNVKEHEALSTNITIIEARLANNEDLLKESRIFFEKLTDKLAYSLDNLVKRFDETLPIIQGAHTKEIIKAKAKVKKRAYDTWMSGLEMIITWIKKNHHDYYGRESYKKTLVDIGAKKISDETEKTIFSLGEKTQEICTRINIEVMPKFMDDITEYIDWISPNKDLPDGWEFKLSRLFHNNWERWRDEYEIAYENIA